MKSLLLKTTLVVIILFIVFNNLVFFSANILSWDVFGYYLYLPFKFIYHDIGLRNGSTIQAIIEKYNNTPALYQAREMHDGNHVFLYTMGMSIFYLPFFVAGHLYAKIFHYPLDGFSLPYQYAIFAGSILV